MMRFAFVFAALAFLVAPQAALAQDADDGPSETIIVAMAKMHVPLGEDRGKFMDFVERVVAPQARNNPNVLAFHVMQHFYGKNSSDVVVVNVYSDWASVEAPCGEPCQTWADANLPDEGEEGYDELIEIRDVYFKYFSQHSDEIYSVQTDLSKFSE